MTELLKKFALKVWVWMGWPQPEPLRVLVEEPYEPPTFSDAYAALENWYHFVMREYVEMYESERDSFIEITVEAEELDDEDDVDDDVVRDYMDNWLHETLDGSEEVIYTARSKAVLLASPNEDAYFESFGDAPPDVHVAAFWTMYQDIMERI